MLRRCRELRTASGWPVPSTAVRCGPSDRRRWRCGRRWLPETTDRAARWADTREHQHHASVDMTRVATTLNPPDDHPWALLPASAPPLGADANADHAPAAAKWGSAQRNPPRSPTDKTSSPWPPHAPTSNPSRPAHARRRAATGDRPPDPPGWHRAMTAAPAADDGATGTSESSPGHRRSPPKCSPAQGATGSRHSDRCHSGRQAKSRTARHPQCPRCPTTPRSPPRTACAASVWVCPASSTLDG